MPLVAFSSSRAACRRPTKRATSVKTLRYYFSSTCSAHLYAFSDWFGAYLGDPASLEYAPNGAGSGSIPSTACSSCWATRPHCLGDMHNASPWRFLRAASARSRTRGGLRPRGLVSLLAAGELVGARRCSCFCSAPKRPRFADAAYIVMTGVFVHSFLSSLLVQRGTYATLAALWLILALQRCSLYRTTSRPLPG